MTQWILKLVEDIQNDKKEKTASTFDLKMIIEETANKQVTKKSRSVSETSEPETNKKRAGRLSETSEVEYFYEVQISKYFQLHQIQKIINHLDNSFKKLCSQFNRMDQVTRPSWRLELLLYLRCSQLVVR